MWLHSFETHLLDVIIRESSAVLELLSGKYKALLIRWNPFLVLNLGLYIVDRVRGLNLQGNSLAREGLHEA